MVPVSVMPETLPLVTVKFPPTEDAARINAVVPLSIVTFADDPVVLNVTAPANTLVLSKVIVALEALVVKLEVLVTETIPVSMIFPVVAVAASVPVKVEAAKSTPVR